MIWHMRLVKLLIVSLLMSGVALYFTSNLLSGTAFAASDELAILNLMNTERAAAGLKPLAWNDKLSQAARAKSIDMITDGYWSHNSPDGKTPWFFMKQAGYRYRSAGENLAKGYDSNAATVNGWMNSAGHKANILSNKYKEAGIATITGKINGVETKLVVAMYGSR